MPGPATLAPGAHAALAPAEAWRVPIHTLAADPVGGEYGWWAAGLTFKASFHDGFVFYPFLGSTYPANLLLRWTTLSVTAGGQALLAAAAEPSHHRTTWRYEYRYGTVTEAYEVLRDGVEQLFVVHRRPQAAGDLVVTGRIDTELEAVSLVPVAAHTALTFRDDKGNALVRYGAAVAFDATGRRTPVSTTFDGRRVELTVSHAWLADATYPVTIDPLTSRVTVSIWGGTTFGLPSYPEVGRDDEATADNVMTFYARQFSASDFDGYGRLTDDDFSGTGLVFTDVTTSWSTGRAGVSFVGGANRWALCLERDFPSPSNTIRARVYTHDSANTTLNSGTVSFHDPSGSETNRTPGIGGTAGFSSGNDALVVYTADVTATKSNTSNSKVYGVLFDAAANSFGTRFEVDTFGGDDDCEFPDVSQVSDGGTSSWMVAYQRLDNGIANDDWDVQCNRVSSTGAPASSFFMGSASGSPTHKLRPQVAGRGGRFTVSMIRDNGTGALGTDIMVERFEWADGAATPTKHGPKVVVADAVNQDFVNGGIAYDSNSDSHWAIVYQRGGFSTGETYVHRLGSSGGTTEAATLYSGPNGAYSPNVTFNDDASEFQIVYGSTDNPPSGLPVYGQRLQYPTTATNVLYGTGCAGSITADRPLAGDEFYTVRLSGAAASSPAVLWLSLAALAPPFPLDPFGLPGCFFHTSPLPGAFITNFPFTTSGSGAASLPLPLSDDPLFIGDLYWQWTSLPGGWGSTRGLRSQVR